MSLMLLSSGKKRKQEKICFPQNSHKSLKLCWRSLGPLQNFLEFLSASLTRSRTPRQHLMLTLCNSSRNEKQELTRVSSSKADFKVHFQAAEQLQMQADGS